jgi:hypothetical protein
MTAQTQWRQALLTIAVLTSSLLAPRFCTANCPGSPVIIDTMGEGFHLTDAATGVPFDLQGKGVKLRWSWTQAGSHNAFLALDRNHNGVIRSGKDLFGNFTPQPKCDHPNGFLALAQFDKAEFGGNEDGVIDEHDAVWSHLVLWIDANHDGISQREELHTLPELGVYSLSFRYTESRYKDAFGNEFRYKAKVNPKGQPHNDHVKRWMYDVWLNGIPLNQPN